MVSAPITTIHLEGKLLEPWLDEVRKSVNTAKSVGPVRLNLTELRFADESGLTLLRSLQDEELELVDTPALIVALMRRGRTPELP